MKSFAEQLAALSKVGYRVAEAQAKVAHAFFATCHRRSLIGLDFRLQGLSPMSWRI